MLENYNHRSTDCLEAEMKVMDNNIIYWQNACSIKTKTYSIKQKRCEKKQHRLQVNNTQCQNTKRTKSNKTQRSK